MADTITYSESVQGWTSFHSYEPEWMVGLGAQFFTFKNGNLYKHDENDVRMEFYGSQYQMKITFVSNEGPSDVKVFKTLKLETNNKNWAADLESEMELGEIGAIGATKFEDKENMMYGYIRRKASDDLNFNELSIVGIGNVVSISGNDYTFSYDIPNQISANNTDGVAGDKLYFLDSGNATLIGVIDSISGKVISTVSSAATPAAGDFLFVAKNPQSESYGLRGYYSSIELINATTSKVEIFAANAEVFKSYM